MINKHYVTCSSLPFLMLKMKEVFWKW